MKALLNLTELSLSKDGSTLLKNISLTVRAGEKVALVGPNGAGKSSLIKVMAGLHRSYLGSAILEGREISSIAPKALSHLVSLVQQRLEFLPSFTVAEFLELHDSCVEDVADRSLKCLEDRYLSDLSGGEVQRVVLAGAIAQQSKLLLMDEPTAHLDPAGRMEVENVIRRYHEEQDISYILVTHDIELAVRCADRIIVMRRGEILWDGDVSDPVLVAKLSEGYGCPFVRVQHPTTSEMVIIPG
jgi:iron complex transport system ATP-binding protein